MPHFESHPLPDDVFFSKLLQVAAERHDANIVNDRSRDTQFGYRHILDGTVGLVQQLEGLIDKSTRSKRGDFFVALLAPTGYEFIIGVLATLALGGAVVPMPTGALPSEAAHIIRQCNACCLLSGPDHGSLATQIQQEIDLPTLNISPHATSLNDLLPLESYTLDSTLALPEETPSIVFLTSGTSGPPKAVLHARRTINKYARTAEIQSFSEICLIPVGAFWSLYFCKIFECLVLGVRVEIENFGRNYDRIWEKLRQRVATKMLLSPTFWYGMMEHYNSHIAKLPETERLEYVEGFRYLRQVSWTGAVLSERVAEFWKVLRGGRPLRMLYGTTETQEISSNDGGAKSVENDLGIPYPHVDIKLSEGDEGEVLVKTPSLFLRYMNRPEDTASRFDSAGYFKTGDLAIRDKNNGRIIFKGRANLDMFKFYTYKVPRSVVESHLLSLSYISEGHVLPVEDSQCDTRVAALVRLKPNFKSEDSNSNVDLFSIRKDLSEGKGLPAYQLPTVLRILREEETVPRTWSDKFAMARAIKEFFPLGQDGRVVEDEGKGLEVLDVGMFMKAKTPKMWDLSGMR